MIRLQRVTLIVGSRPEAVKMAPVVFALRQRPDHFDVCLCSTGQHREMIPQALDEFGLTADITLDVMRENQTLASLTARLMKGVDGVLVSNRPDWVLVQGDTTSAMAGALTAFYRRIPVGHIEAGLRTGDPSAPFPEEINRRIISQCATLHFAITEKNRKNLLSDGVPDDRIILTGNTVIDALLWMRDELSRVESRLPAPLRAETEGRRLLLATSHRRENFGTGLMDICQALRRIAQRHEDVVIVLPVHPNPNVGPIVRHALSNTTNIHLIDPLPYGAFVELMDRAYLILTDSGGLQEEAPSLGKPLLVMREETERPEGIDAGVAQLVGTDPQRIVEETSSLLNDNERYDAMTRSRNPYGDGRAAQRIVAALLMEGPKPELSTDRAR